TSLSSLVEQWLQWDQDPKTRAEIEHLRDAGATEELELRLRHRIEFGTAGLRGRMAAGFACMNSLTVIQASQGLAIYIKTKKPEIAKQGVVIGHDARHNSNQFARLAANAFIALSIPVWFFDQYSPTPMVPFGVNHYKAAAGIMVTASHNPPQDNGYKVYSNNGAQINRPEDAEISQSICENLEPWSSAWKDLETSDLLHDKSYQDLFPHYVSRVVEFTKSTSSYWMPSKMDLGKPYIYTPLHGVGDVAFNAVFELLGVPEHHLLSVPAQKNPDPDFPTVKFPNPEETGALDLAIEAANKKRSILIFANDPDADRFAVAERVDGKMFQFTGDQIGVLLATYLLDSSRDGEGANASDITVLSSAVSSGLLQRIAEDKGFKFKETLTGFKWMANEARNLEKIGRVVPFAYEEALGYMFPSVCYDKDGITAAAVFLAAHLEWARDGTSIYQKLENIWASYGYHETLNNYFRSPSPALAVELFRGIRSGPFLAEMKFGNFKIERWRDLTEGYDSATPDNKPELPVDPTSQMLTLWLDKGVRFTFRGSGTEPKVKFYIESRAEPHAPHRDATQAACDAFTTLLHEWVERYTPEMTYSKQLRTSSGYVLDL
ncbi:hypothetical protein N7532_001757, partial [Penicillium argentinense]